MPTPNGTPWRTRTDRACPVGLGRGTEQAERNSVKVSYLFWLDFGRMCGDNAVCNQFLILCSDCHFRIESPLAHGGALSRGTDVIVFGSLPWHHAVSHQAWVPRSEIIHARSPLSGTFRAPAECSQLLIPVCNAAGRARETNDDLLFHRQTALPRCSLFQEQLVRRSVPVAYAAKRRISTSVPFAKASSTIARTERVVSASSVYSPHWPQT